MQTHTVRICFPRRNSKYLNGNKMAANRSNAMAVMINDVRKNDPIIIVAAISLGKQSGPMLSVVNSVPRAAKMTPATQNTRLDARRFIENTLMFGAKVLLLLRAINAQIFIFTAINKTRNDKKEIIVKAILSLKVSTKCYNTKRFFSHGNVLYVDSIANDKLFCHVRWVFVKCTNIHIYCDQQNQK